MFAWFNAAASSSVNSREDIPKSAAPPVAASIPADEPFEVMLIVTSGFKAMYSSAKTSITGVTDVDPTTSIVPSKPAASYEGNEATTDPDSSSVDSSSVADSSSVVSSDEASSVVSSSDAASSAPADSSPSAGSSVVSSDADSSVVSSDEASSDDSSPSADAEASTAMYPSSSTIVCPS